MNHRTLGNSSHSVSEIGLGCWQLGGDWGHVNDETAFEILHAAVESEITLLDTADVYGAGRSETLIGKFLKERSEDLFVATKIGRRNFPGPYTPETMREHIMNSLGNLGVEALDLVQLHCVPREVMAEGSIFDSLRSFQQEGLIRNFGASVESMEEANLILNQPGLTSLQIIFNIFRQKPIHTLFEAALERKVGLIIRLPLASGVLAGKFNSDTTFGEDDHRNYNRDGAAFNAGETFAGLPFAKSIEVADQIKSLVPEGMTMSQFSQRWILDHDAVSTVITGASRPEQAKENASVSDLPALSPEVHEQLASLYESEIHQHIRGVY